MNEKTQLFGYHLKDITKGELGEFSKIKEMHQKYVILKKSLFN